MSTPPSTPDTSPTAPSTASPTSGLLPIPAEVDRTDVVALARSILDLAIDDPLHVTVFSDGAVMFELLSDCLMVDGLLLRTAPPQVAMVGIAAPALASRRATPDAVDGGPLDRPRSGRVVHLVDRAGVSATTLDAGEATTLVFGPTTEPQSGRVPDVCRRMLALPTEPPSCSMTPFVFGAWLAVVTGNVQDGDWGDAVLLHPSSAVLDDAPTAAEVAAATKDLGESMDWDRFRHVIAAVGGFPFGPDGASMARWMDAGMFSRWAMDELPSAQDALRTLSRQVTPDAIDRLWAVAHLCGALGDDASVDD